MRALLNSRIAWALFIALVLVGAYALFGFHTVPRILRYQAGEFVRHEYGRELSVGEIRFNPFRLQLEIEDLSLPDADGRPMLAFERLFVDFEASSLWKRAFYFRELTLDGPLVRAVVRPDGAINLADLALESEAEPETDDDELVSLWLELLEISKGRVEFVDQSRQTPLEWQFTPVDFRLADFRTTPDGGDFRLSATSEFGTEMNWKGVVALSPQISSSGEMTIAGVPATRVEELLGEALPFGLSQGLLNAGASYTFAMGDEISLEISLPTIEVADLALHARAVDENWVTLPSTVLSDTTLSLTERLVRVGRIDVEGLTVTAWMNEDGSTNLQQLFEAPGGSDPSATADSASADAARGGFEVADVEPVAEQPAPTDPDVSGGPGEVKPADPEEEEEEEEDASRTAARVESAEQKEAAADRISRQPVAAGAETPSPTETPPATTDTAAEDWRIAIDHIDVGSAEIDFEDRMLAPGTRARIAPLAVTLKDLSLDLSRPIPVTVAATVNDHASINVAGEVTPDPLAASLDLNVDGARMTILQPYILPVADLTIKEGLASVDGRVVLSPPEAEGPEIGFDGEISLRGFKSIDNAIKQDFVNFDLLRLSELSYTMAPDELTIGKVLVRKPYARLIISENQVINIQAVLDPEGAAAGLSARQADEDEKVAATPEPTRSGNGDASAESMPIRIGEVKIENGNLNFSDYFVQPNFSANVIELNGRVTKLSTDPQSRSKVDMNGKLGKFSPVTIVGEMQPFAFDSYTDMDMKFADIPLPVFNPYSGRFAGFNIATGMLTTELHYLIQKRALKADHHILIEQLEWGEATASKEAATLPVKLATSLLKDADGVIDLDLPVEGTLDDPEFKIGPIIWDIIKNLITKAVTAPFKLLGSLFEGAEDAQFVEFMAGDAVLSPESAAGLGALVQALTQRPELKIVVPVGVIPELDTPALAEQRYKTELESAAESRQVKRGKAEDALLAYDALSDAGKVKVLSGILKRRTGAAPNIPAPPPPPEGTSKRKAQKLADAAAVTYLEEQVRSGIEVSELDLNQLAKDRAEAIRVALLEGTGIDPGRVIPSREGKLSQSDGKVRFELGVDN